MARHTYRSFERQMTEADPVGMVDGRRHVALTFEAFDPHGTRRETRTVEVALAGPRDAIDLFPGAVGSVYPAPNATDAECGYLCTAELAESDIPWRYSPTGHDGDAPTPWIVLVVGTIDEITLHDNNTVEIRDEALLAHNLADAALWAHVEDLPTGKVARLISPRAPVPEKEHLAVIVPALDQDAQPAWSDTEVTLPCFHHWRFQTGGRVTFQQLVERIETFPYTSGVGTNRVQYPRLGDSTFDAPGALQPPAAAPYPLVDDAILTDVASLRVAAVDDTDRTAVGARTYGARWFPESTLDASWAKQLNDHPAMRVAAGLGAAASTHYLDRLARAVSQHAGDFDIAEERIRHLTLGTTTSSSLWKRRLPHRLHDRLMLLGPALGRIVTEDGVTMLDAATGRARPLAGALFSGAGQRLLRPSTGWSRLAGDGADPANVIEFANKCPKPNPTCGSADDLLASSANGLQWGGLLDLVADGLPSNPLLILIDLLLEWWDDWHVIPDAVTGVFDKLQAQFLDDEFGDWVALFDFYLALTTSPDIDSLLPAIAAIEVDDDAQDGPPVQGLTPGEPLEEPCKGVDLTELDAVLASAIDPTHGGRAAERVLASLAGVVDTLPPRIDPHLDIPLWSFLRDQAPEWLIPNVRHIRQDRIAVLEPNPQFIEAFMIGANTQLLESLRRYDLRLASNATPLKAFWGRFRNDGTIAADIPDIGDFGRDNDLGSHVAASGGRVAVVVRSTVFTDYPNTLLYLIETPLDGNGRPDFRQLSGLLPIWPTFQGAVGDIVLLGFDVAPDLVAEYTLVFEEAERDPRFEATEPSPEDEDSASFASLRIAVSHRVMFPEFA